ncbi:permease component of ABC-type sugar transporter [Caldisphaera lagunensis DSM 15908]|uniref:Permease component of ABC-type sugar transporter n=1 Tax=Caldisphaera lagunensis (strain DSM 15908 / JCM 11604 / ANMR 0165 / IC-154) TaxID=1056495 RepID=L0AB85_CALLD|nr:glucose ABC transporter permease GlcT [Caldisphaera lagunensis]AFZ70679.1 permease component of ABC-type sugar transporter [Caldisphaera lagunensis DSM 15908]
MKKQAYLMVIPTLFFSGLLLVTVVWNLWLSFQNWSILVHKPKFVGLSTYQFLFSQYFFKISTTHTIVFTIGLIAIGNLLGLFIAGLLYFIPSNVQRSIYLSIFIYPLAIASSTSALIWEWLLNPTIGIDWLLKLMHLPAPYWLGTPNMSLLSMVMIEIWAYTGLAALFYLAAFMGIDKSIIEAAKLDKAGNFKILFRILIPNSMNGFIISTALLFLFSFRLFTIPFVLGGSATSPTLMTYVMYVYNLFISEYFSASAAMAIIVTIIAAAVILPFAIFGLMKWVFKR